jgi:septum formation protein
MSKLVLASASPRRADLLRAAGFEFDVIPAEIDETIDIEETPDGYVRRVAQLKAQAVALQAPGRAILAADTIVVLDHEVLGKPVDTADAHRMLRRLAGRDHVVMTAVCLLNPGPAEAGHYVRGVRLQPDLRGVRLQPDLREGGSKRFETRVARTTVEFAPLSDAEIDWYLATGEPMDKAGAYAVQGLASRFVTRVDGSYSNVVGLPVAVVYALCRGAGLLIS